MANTIVKLTETIDLEFSVKEKQIHSVREILTNNDLKFSDNTRNMSPLKIHDFTVYGASLRTGCTLKILFKTAKIDLI